MSSVGICGQRSVTTTITAIVTVGERQAPWGKVRILILWAV